MLRNKLFLEAFDYFIDILQLIKNGYNGKIDIILSGSRNSGKTMNAMIFCGVLFYMIDADIIFMRETPTASKETFNQFKAISLEYLNYHYKNFNKTDRQYNYNNHLIRFKGYKSNVIKDNSKLGIYRDFKAKVKVRFWDEVVEFNNHKPIFELNEAQGAGDVTINIFTYNPFSPYNIFVKEHQQYLKYNRKIMKEIGSNYKYQWINDNWLRIVHHSNHRINNMLSPETHKELLNLHKIDPRRAITADLGLPGIERGAVYVDVLERVKNKPFNSKIMEYRAGLDWGESDNYGGSAVACIFGRIGQEFNWISFDNEYYHSNSKGMNRKTTQQLAHEVVNFLHNQITSDNLGTIKYLGGITCYVDNAATGIINALEQEAKLLRFGMFLSFERCIKIKVEKRIKLMRYGMGTNKIFCNKTMCPNLWSEWNMAMYDIKAIEAGKPEIRYKKDDDCLDASEYLLNSDILYLADKTYKLLYN